MHREGMHIAYAYSFTHILMLKQMDAKECMHIALSSCVHTYKYYYLVS